MLEISFQVNYQTQWGQQVVIFGSTPELGIWNYKNGIRLDYQEGGNWTKTLQFNSSTDKIAYKYAVVDQYNNRIDEEWEHPRTINLTNIEYNSLQLCDAWRPRRNPENGFENGAFLDVLFKPEPLITSAIQANGALTFQIRAPRIEANQQLCLLGNTPELGNWDLSNPILLGNEHYPNWTGHIPFPAQQNMEYKYGIYDTKQKQVLFLEDGPNRTRTILSGKEHTIISDIFFNHPKGLWKGTGVAIPVFSLRSESSFGVGSFTDIKKLVDWAEITGMKLVQILPVNDTAAQNNWIDSYPYAAISVFALHPQYLDVSGMKGFEEIVDQQEYQKLQAELNALPQVDYEQVMAHKLRYVRQIFEKQRTSVLKSKAFKAFFEATQHWLMPYAYFCMLRDQNQTADFNQWGEDAIYSREKMEQATNPKSKTYKEITFHYYLQFYLDKQLMEVADYARKRKVILKGDIPIGIYRYSVDAWTQPNLYHMDSQSGAPPDPFSELGQNWGFPTYNWPEMAKDGYLWWQNRFKTLARYFDTFRIDHILGFFRIWQIPLDHVEGTLGYFNPAIPITLDELRDRGIPFDYQRFCKPFITEAYVQELFGTEAEFIKSTFLQAAPNGLYEFIPAFDTQRKVEAYFKETAHEGKKDLHVRIFKLHSNVLFIEDPRAPGQHFHPRIEFQKTNGFKSLPGGIQHQLNDLYNDYYYSRQDGFWHEQAMTKLPAIKRSTNMLVCGEDLGMIPASVPPVMKELDILTLEIQRMSKNPQTEFLQANDIPYLSVCSPSTHDMSPIRAWWEESESDYLQRFYYNELQLNSQMPKDAETQVVRAIIQQHLDFPSMWAIFPIQDLLGLSAELRHPVPMDERINIPANVPHYWRYRMHINMEDLLEAEKLNEQIGHLLELSNRRHE